MGCTLLQLNTGGILLRYVTRRDMLEGSWGEVPEWKRAGEIWEADIQGSVNWEKLMQNNILE